MRDPYQAYVNNGILGDDPVRLVVALYETAIKRTQEARECLDRKDIMGRARAISKASNILMELIVTLNPNEGAHIGKNLDRLYHYMLRRLQDAHLRQVAEPLIEVEKLLSNLLEAWYVVAAETDRNGLAPAAQPSALEERCEDTISYSSYLPDELESAPRTPVLG